MNIARALGQERNRPDHSSLSICGLVEDAFVFLTSLCFDEIGGNMYPMHYTITVMRRLMSKLQQRGHPSSAGSDLSNSCRGLHWSVFDTSVQREPIGQ